MSSMVHQIHVEEQRVDFSTTGRKTPDDDVAKVTWEDFIGNTSFHGCRFIFVDSKSSIRRLAWLLVVLSSVGLFSYQVITRTRSYFDYHSNVNVQVIYESEVTFPTVTICNQNNFRMTAIVEKDIIGIVQKEFAPSIFKKRNVASGREVTLQEVSHQVDDLIRSCMWRGKPCLSENIEKISTDFGECFVLNRNKTKTSENGSGSGLSLLLNIEEYEYSWGPHNEAGIKVVLHAPEEYPQVSDLGFAVAPGTQTLVSVRREEIQSLPPPYGLCSPGAPPRANCLLSCRSRTTQKQCECLESYMDRQLNASICDFEVSLTCSSKVTGGSAGECNCKTPCNRVIYTPELSFAHLSKSNIRSLLPESEQMRTKLRDKYIKAREATYQHHPTYFNQTKAHFLPVENASKAFTESFNLSLNLISEQSTLENMTGIPKSILMILKYMAEDVDILNKRFQATYNLFLQKYDPSVFQAYQYYFKSDILPDYDTLKYCADEETAGRLFSTGCAFAGPYFDKVHQFVGLLTRVRNDIKTSEPFYKSYYIDRLFGNTPVYDDALQRNETKVCIENIKTIQAEWQDKTQVLGAQVQSYMMAVTNVQKYTTVHAMYEFYNDTKAERSPMNSTWYEPCHWFFRDDLVNKSFTDDANNAESSVQAGQKGATKSVNQAVQYGRELLKYLKDYAAEIFHCYPDHIHNSNQTLTSLHQHVTGQTYRSNMDNILNSVTLYRNNFQDILKQYESIVSSLKLLITLQDDLRFPFRSDDMENLHIVKIANESLSSKPEVAFFLSMIGKNDGVALVGLFDEVYGVYTTVLEDTFGHLSEYYRGLSDTSAKARQHLNDFIDANQLNENFLLDNFLKLDIFYKEISYTLINQTPAFEFISLLSEVGGFMGLLLGASVITLCELIDYVILTSLKRCRYGGEVTPQV